MSEFETTRNTRTIMIAVVVIVIIGSGGLVGLMYLGGLTPTTTSPTGETLTILTRHDISIQSVFEPAFLASDYAIDNGIVDIAWKAPLQEYWDNLIDAGEVDVCWGGGPTLFDQLMRDGRLYPLTSSLMQNASSRVHDEIAGADMKRNNSLDELVWIGAAISTFGFTVNNVFLTDRGLPTPTKWTDLALPVYGQYLKAIPTIAMGNAPGTTSNTRIYEIITQALGWEAGWINMARMAGNARIYGGSVETQTASENGDVGISMSIDFYGYLTQFRNPDCEYIVPEGQSIVNGDPIAIAATSTNKDLAEVFIDFVLSPYGQSLWLHNNIRRMPIMGEAFTQPLGLNAPDLHTNYDATLINVGIDFNDTLSLETNMAFISYFESVYTNAHAELVDTWELIVSAYYDGHINETQLDYYADLMGTPVSIIDPDTSILTEFTVDYAKTVNTRMIYDAAYASVLQTLWTNAMKLQYLDVYDAVAALLP